MTYRAIILVPEGLTFEQLTQEQQDAINSVFGQFVLPMPSTIAANGTVICDALTSDKFNANNITGLGLPFKIIGIWKEDSTPLIPFNSGEFIDHLPSKIIYDEEGNEIGSTPATLHEPHTWAGWDTVIV
jgi:hypothetical protein